MKTTLVVAVLALVLAGNAFGTSFSKRTLSDAHVGNSKAELQAQIQYSERMERFFTVSHHWMIATKHSTCWAHVPWATTCNRARTKLRAYEWLRTVASGRMAHLYPPSVEDIIMNVFGSQGSFAESVAWCESKYSTAARNGQYHGIFQMGAHERAVYGGSSNDPQEQVEAAHRYFLDAGWGPWECA